MLHAEKESSEMHSYPILVPNIKYMTDCDMHNYSIVCAHAAELIPLSELQVLLAQPIM